MLSFGENFWGEKINGFEVLCANLKHSLSNVKELETLLRETANCEDSYSKLLNKLVAQLNKFAAHGSCSPLWSPMRELNERYAHTHAALVHDLHDLIKDTQRYHEELAKRVKKIRESETPTQNVVQSFQDMQLQLTKTRDQYHNLCGEFEKLRRQLDSQQLLQLQQQQQLSSSNLLAYSTGVNGSMQTTSAMSNNNNMSVASTTTTAAPAASGNSLAGLVASNNSSFVQGQLIMGMQVATGAIGNHIPSVSAGSSGFGPAQPWVSV